MNPCFTFPGLARSDSSSELSSIGGMVITLSLVLRVFAVGSIPLIDVSFLSS